MIQRFLIEEVGQNSVVKSYLHVISTGYPNKQMLIAP